MTVLVGLTAGSVHTDSVMTGRLPSDLPRAHYSRTRKQRAPADEGSDNSKEAVLRALFSREALSVPTPG